MVSNLTGIQNPNEFVDNALSVVDFKESDIQQILEIDNTGERLIKFKELFSKETEILKIERKISSKVKESIDKNQKEFYLREQIKAIHNELGDNEGFRPYGSKGGILRVKTGRVQKTSLIKKGIATLLFGYRFKQALRLHLGGVRFDLILYSTPPITLYSIVKYVKRRDKAMTYLLLKDIFPQNALDIGMMSKRGLLSPIYYYFRFLEKRLYAISDRIGCMSEANVEYLKKQDPEIPDEKIHVCPNSIEPCLERLSPEQKRDIRERYGLPTDKKIFIYGGNIGKPQGVPFIIECLKAVSDLENCHFVVCVLMHVGIIAYFSSSCFHMIF